MEPWLSVGFERQGDAIKLDLVGSPGTTQLMFLHGIYLAATRRGEEVFDNWDTLPSGARYAVEALAQTALMRTDEGAVGFSEDVAA